jgi:Gpi18-like mannosyltransferase
MFKIERKIVEFVERNVNILFMLAITGLAIVVRYAGRDFVSGDMTWFLLGWFQKIADNGGIHSLKNQVGDYNILYQTIVALFTYIGDKSIYYYKILSIFFDFCMAISAAIFACELSKKEKNDKVFFVTFAVVIMLPTVILNSAYWGQCDSIYTTFIILTLLYLYKGKYHSAFVFLGIAFAFKMQTILLYVSIFIKNNLAYLNFLLPCSPSGYLEYVLLSRDGAYLIRLEFMRIRQVHTSICM